MTRQYYSVPELAEKLGLSKQALYKAIKAKRLHVEMVGSTRLVPIKEARRWVWKKKNNFPIDPRPDSR